jgi:TonB-dependent starch-binding outer membrane protein SusC
MKLSLQLRRYLFAVTLLLSAIAFSMPLLAQNSRVVSGIVKDKDGNPLSGATVIAKSTSTSTVTNVAGTFSFTVPTNTKTLVISYVGMEEKEVAITSQNNLNITLTTKGDAALNDVVMVGNAKPVL